MLDIGSSIALYDLDPYFPEAKDYSGAVVQSAISVTSYSHTLTSNFFTPDINWDGSADFTDISLYLAMNGSSIFDERADWDMDGDADADDVMLFMNAYSAY